MSRSIKIIIIVLLLVILSLVVSFVIFGVISQPEVESGVTETIPSEKSAEGNSSLDQKLQDIRNPEHKEVTKEMIKYAPGEAHVDEVISVWIGEREFSQVMEYPEIKRIHLEAKEDETLFMIKMKVRNNSDKIKSLYEMRTTVVFNNTDSYRLYPIRYRNNIYQYFPDLEPGEEEEFTYMQMIDKKSIENLDDIRIVMGYNYGEEGKFEVIEDKDKIIEFELD